MGTGAGGTGGWRWAAAAGPARTAWTTWWTRGCCWSLAGRAPGCGPEGHGQEGKHRSWSEQRHGVSATPRDKGPRVTSDSCAIPPASSTSPRQQHPELFPKLFALPEAISHHELAPFPPSPLAEGSADLLALHSHGHQGQTWGHQPGDNKALEVPAELLGAKPQGLAGSTGIWKEQLMNPKIFLTIP